MTGYYDVVLGAIPLALLGVAGSLTVATDLALTTAVTIGALVAAGLICHALFVNAPVDVPTAASGRGPAVEHETGDAAPGSGLVDAD